MKITYKRKRMEKRVIKFRGKRIDNGEWVYGLVYNLSYRGEILTMIQTDDYAVKNGSYYGHEVDEKTLSQFTGLLDKNGKEIYAGDVDRFGWVVCFEDGVFCLKQTLSAKTFIAIHESNIDEVIGNIYQHPNLLTEPTGK